jgi:hypothetical protein
MDLYRPVLSVSQAAKLLGYKPKEIRRLLGQGKISVRKLATSGAYPSRPYSDGRTFQWRLV